MKNDLKNIKEFIILLDVLNEMTINGVLKDSNQEKEMNEVLNALKKFVGNGVLKDLEEIEEMLIVVDTVNGFMKEGALANNAAMHIVPEQIKLIEKVLERNGLVVFVKEAHTKNSVEFKTFPPHCEIGSKEAELIDELKHYEKQGISIEKNSTSFMFARGFLNLIRLMKNLKRVIGCGVCSDICVPDGFIPLHKYFNQNNRDVELIIPEMVVETFDASNHSRDEYWHASKLLMEQSGIKLVKKVNDIEWRS